MAIGATAPLVILALRRQPAFAAGRLFWVWNLLGMLDLVVAVGLGALSAVLGIGISAEITTFPMGRMPLVIVPTFLVPLFLMLHLASLLQARRTGRGREGMQMDGADVSLRNRRGYARGIRTVPKRAHRLSLPGMCPQAKAPALLHPKQVHSKSSP